MTQKQNNNIIDIAFCFNENVKDLFCTAIVSILVHSHENDVLNFHIIDAGLSDKTMDDIKKLRRIKDFTIEYKKPKDDLFKNFADIGDKHFLWYRLNLPDMFPQVKRILYLDVDIFVVDSLSVLFNLDLGKHIVAFAPNGNLEKMLQNERLGLTSTHIYFNAGVMLLDCVRYRQNNIAKKAATISMEMIDKLVWKDQDILNIIFENNYKLLPPKYNRWSGITWDGFEATYDNYCTWLSHTNIQHDLIAEAIKNPTIIHCAGGGKPDAPTAPKFVKKLYKRYIKIYDIAINAEKNFFTKLCYMFCCLFIKYIKNRNVKLIAK